MCYISNCILHCIHPVLSVLEYHESSDKRREVTIDVPPIYLLYTYHIASR